MKVVLFCGGLGLRLREAGENTPKPLTAIGNRPILWHLMKYYAHFGHKEFILCLGYRGVDIKNYFLNYTETLSNDFVLAKGGREVSWRRTDVDRRGEHDRARVAEFAHPRQHIPAARRARLAASAASPTCG